MKDYSELIDRYQKELEHLHKRYYRALSDGLHFRASYLSGCMRQLYKIIDDLKKLNEDKSARPKEGE